MEKENVCEGERESDRERDNVCLYKAIPYYKMRSDKIEQKE